MLRLWLVEKVVILLNAAQILEMFVILVMQSYMTLMSAK